MPCNGKGVQSHLSELHWHVEPVQSHNCFAFGGGDPRGEKKDKGQRIGSGRVIHYQCATRI